MRIFLLCLSLLSLVSARAQHHHFLYIQSDQQQPFYVKAGSNLMSSSAEGFLIIPRLKDSTYEMVIGFPAKKFPEYIFRFSGFKKDRGMALKNFGEKGWGLFDYQTLDILMGEKIPEKEEPKVAMAAPLTNDAFTVVLASVIDDPGLLATPLVQMTPGGTSALSQPVAKKETTAAQPEVPKQATAEIARTSAIPPVTKPVVGDTTVKPVSGQPVVKAAAVPPKEAASVGMKEQTAGKKEILAPAVAEAAAVVAVEKMKPTIQRLREEKRPEGLAITYLDQPGVGVADTVQVMIPYSVAMQPATVQEGKDTLQAKADMAVMETPVVVAPVKAAEKVTEPPAKKSDVVLETQTEKVAEPPAKKQDVMLETQKGKVAEPPTQKSDVVLETQTGKAPVKEEQVVVDSPAVNMTVPADKPAGPPNRSNCVRMASEKDLAAVRKRIVGIKDEDEMVLAALRDFKQRCYSTEQVKTISYVFTREEGKYKLLDAAYPYVFDPSNYGQLESLLKDKYFIYRFKALVSR